MKNTWRRWEQHVHSSTFAVCSLKTCCRGLGRLFHKTGCGGWAQGPLSPSLINRKGGCDGEPGFPTSTFCSIMGKAGCGSSFTDPQTIHSKAWPRAGVFSVRDVARRGLGQSTCPQMLRTPHMPWSLAYAQRLPWPSLP